MHHANQLAAVLLVTATIACGGSPSAPSTSTLGRSLETDHFVFHYSSGDTVDAAWQETYHQWAVATLDVQPTGKITYNKYLSRQQMGDIIGVSNTNGFADRSTFAINTIWPIDNHETVHLYSSLFASPGPVALFSEGLAVAFQVDPARGDFVPKWSGVPLDDIARGRLAAGQLPTLSEIVETNGFRSIDSTIAYPIAGSFVHYVLDRFGLPMLKTFFARGTPTDSAAAVRNAFLDVYGIGLDVVEQDWRGSLGR